MFEKLKRFGRNFTQTTPFILSNTIILIPYLLFLGITDSHNWLTILPFTLFYAFRMTGLFLVNSLRFGLDSYTLLMIALLMGGTGSLLGILGVFYFPLFYFSSVLLGLSAAWLVPANITVNFHEKTQGFINMDGKNTYLQLSGYLSCIKRSDCLHRLRLQQALRFIHFFTSWPTIRSVIIRVTNWISKILKET